MEPAPQGDITSYLEIGTLLRQAREQMRLTLDQSARLLHIRMRYLDALEQGHLYELPGLTYTRGYLQAYAAFLGLDKDEVLRRFEDVEGQLARKHIYFPEVFSKEKKPNHTIIGMGLMLAFFAYLFWAVFLKTVSHHISIVENIPQKREDIHISADTGCMHAPDAVYPPCVTSEHFKADLVPLGVRMTSIMQFPLLHLVDEDEDTDNEQRND